MPSFHGRVFDRTEKRGWGTPNFPVFTVNGSRTVTMSGVTVSSGSMVGALHYTGYDFWLSKLNQFNGN